jgi:hypothetical protein
MRALPIVFLLALCAGVAHAQGGGSGTPPRREDPLQRKLQSVVQLEMIEAGLKRRPASATDGNTTLAQVREDFWRIQLANDDLNNVLLGPGLDVDVIKKTASEIRTRAKRLKENLALPRPDKGSELQIDPEAQDLRSSVTTLSQLVESFVSNPMLSQKHVIDATLSLKASRDLEEMIGLSGRIKKIAGQKD